MIETLERTVRWRWICASRPPPSPKWRENTPDDPGFPVPKVDWERTARDCLTIEWIDGIKLADHAALDAAGH